MNLTKFAMQPTIHVNPYNRCKCNVGCIANFVRLIITREMLEEQKNILLALS
jgi:hypothetical protein